MYSNIIALATKYNEARSQFGVSMPVIYFEGKYLYSLPPRYIY